MGKLFIILAVCFVIIVFIGLGKLLWEELIQFIYDERDKFDRIKHQFDKPDDK